jgi:hypothetical protein
MAVAAKKKLTLYEYTQVYGFQHIVLVVCIQHRLFYRETRHYRISHRQSISSFSPHPSFFASGYQPLRELLIPDTVLSMLWYGDTICLGYKKEYTILNQDTGEVSDIGVPVDGTRPLVQMTSPEELLLSSNLGIGIFVSFQGEAVNKSNIAWSENPVAFARCSFYIVALLRSSVEIFSLIDQRRVQSTPLPLGALLSSSSSAAAAAALAAASTRRRSIFDIVKGGFGGSSSSAASSGAGFPGAFQAIALCGGEEEPVLVASEAQIYRLRPTPIDEQIGAYLRAVQVRVLEICIWVFFFAFASFRWLECNSFHSPLAASFVMCFSDRFRAFFQCELDLT